MSNLKPLRDITPFHPLIIKSNFNFDWVKIKPICERLINTTIVNTPLEKNDAKSSATNSNPPHLMPEFADFYKWLSPMVQHIIINEWGYADDIGYAIVNSWVNLHKKGGLTLEHNHTGTLLVCTTYLNIPKNSGYIEFKDPLEYQKSFHARKDINWEWFEVQAETGDSICFPGWMKHRTQPSASDEDRWVLTTNIVSIGPKK